jgi:predicted Rossmann fold nucleotide-binding protein DprA/Smf involved in DNA uptake
LISNNAETVIEDMIGISEFYDGRNKERDSEEKEKEKNHSKRKNDKKDDILVQPLDENEKKIYKIIGSSDVFIDDIISITGLSPGVCIRGVIELMRGGFIKETERGYYIRRINL